MKKEIVFLSFILGFVICSCSSPTGKNTKLENISVGKLRQNTIPFSSVFDNYEIIKLETKKDNLIKKIKKIKYADNKYFILTNKTIQIYTQDGKFVSIIDRKGEGNEEYIGISDFYINPSAQTIEVNDYNLKKIITYDWYGKYLSEWKHGLLIDKFDKIDNNRYVFYCMTFLNGDYNKRVLFVDKQNNKIVNSGIDITDNETWYLYIGDQTNFISTYENNCFMYSQNDTIYSIRENEITPFKLINFEEESISKDFYNKKHDDIFHFMQDLKKKSLVGLIDNYHDTGDVLSFTAKKQDLLHQVFYDKINHKSINAKFLKDDMVFKGHKFDINYDFYPLIGDEDHLYYPLQSYNVIQIVDSINNLNSHPEIDDKILKLSKEGSFLDNPYLLKLHVKKNFSKENG